MIKPNFIVIGAAKSATSSLSRLLGQHPDVCFSKPKEPRFFSHDENFIKGWKWYEDHFSISGKPLAIGEGSVHYSMRTLFPNSAKRISEALPNCKLIYIVRHPLDRIASHWRMYQIGGKTQVTSLSEDVQKASLKPTLIDASKYWFQINAYRDFFPDENIFVLFFEDFSRYPEQSVYQCFKFLNLDLDVDLTETKKTTNSAQSNVFKQRDTFSKLICYLPIPQVTQTAISRRWQKFKSSSSSSKVEQYPFPDWEIDTRKWVVDQIIEDSTKFLNFYGKDSNFWSFD